MKARSPKRHWRKDWVVTAPDLLHPTGVHGGECVRVLARINAPKATEFRWMLLELRHRFRWPQSFTAGLMNVSVSAITKWETGVRQPTGAAAKLIWLFHSALINNACWNAFGVASWGKDPGITFRDAETLGTILLQGGTFFTTSEELAEAAKGTQAA